MQIYDFYLKHTNIVGLFNKKLVFFDIVLNPIKLNINYYLRSY